MNWVRVGKFKTSVTKLVDGLEKRHLIQRVPLHPTDRRSNVIQLTPKGKNLKMKLTPIVKKTLDKVHKNISKRASSCFSRSIATNGKKLKLVFLFI